MARVAPLTVALTHPELGRLIVNECDVPAWKAKGWSVEGEEVTDATPKPGDSGTPDVIKSADVTVKQAAEVISGLDSSKAVTAYVDGDARKGVCDVTDTRLEELEE